MTVRLHTLLRASLALSRGTDPKARANGYSHSYLDPETARIESLAVFPSDEEIVAVVDQAWDEAVALLSLVGIQSDDINNSVPDPVPNVGEKPDGEHDHLDESDHGMEDRHKDEFNVAQLQRLIGVQETKDWGTVDTLLQEKMHVMMCAAMALDINDMETL